MLSNAISRLVGTGTLAPQAGQRAFTVRFALQRLHWHFEIGVELSPGDQSDFGIHSLGNRSWELDGTLEDGRPVQAGDLLCASTSPEILLLPLKSVELGVRGSGPIRSVTYPLVGMYYGDGCTRSVDDFELSISDAELWDGYTRQDARAFGRSLESKALVLSALPREISEPECWERFQIITRLLTLASGEGVTAHRRIVNWESGEQAEIWRVATGDELGPGMLIPEACLEEFLAQSYIEWKSWSKDDQALAARVLSYLNMSTVGYLDVRLFHVMQALESLANAWLETSALSDKLQVLRQCLLDAYRSWRDPADKDPDGFWGSRVSSIFDWARLRQKLEELFASMGIDLGKLDLDLSILKKARDGVGHSGILPEELGENPTDALRHLQAGQLALQLLLLSRLGYSGSLHDRRSDWVRTLDMDQFAP